MTHEGRTIARTEGARALAGGQFVVGGCRGHARSTKSRTAAGNSSSNSRARVTTLRAMSALTSRAPPSAVYRAHFLKLRGGDVPLGRARAKNRGPLQAVLVMARAMAERLA